MDPLSIIASTLTIATSIAVGLQQLRSLRHARTDILLLANELAELIIILRELDQILQQRNRHGITHPDAALLQTLDAVKKKLEELSKQVASWNRSTSSPGKPANLRAPRWANISSRVKAFKDELQKGRNTLSTCLSALQV